MLSNNVVFQKPFYITVYSIIYDFINGLSSFVYSFYYALISPAIKYLFHYILLLEKVYVELVFHALFKFSSIFNT